MKNTTFLFLVLLPCVCLAQNKYWQQQADVRIQVQLNDSAHTLDAFETITYTNNSPDTLHFIWFHLWPNAYKNDRTAFSNQLLELGNTDFYFSNKEAKGYINRLNFKVDGITAKTEDHPEHIDIVKLVLPKPLPPSTAITITTPFHVKLPSLFSRSGYSNGVFQLTQWYPKPAVYDAQGWHPMPYVEQGEYYSEFGDYDVSITLPQPYVVAATGVLQTPEELQWLQTRTGATTETQKPTATLQHGVSKKSQHTTKKDTATNFFKTSYPLKTIRFTQQHVHDFALVASMQFQVDADTCQLPSGKIINVFSYYTNRFPAWQKSISFTKDALRFYSAAVGDYPYTTMHVVESPVLPGGMEYPTLTIIGPIASESGLDDVATHEIGHNWFYGALATNERDAPWMDEGLNTFYEQQYMTRKYGTDNHLEALLLRTAIVQKKDQPITTGSQQFSELNYALVAYYKAATWFALVQKQAGAEAFRNGMHRYFEQWQFKHPQAADLKKALAAVLPDTTAFDLLTKTGNLPIRQPASFKIVSPVIPGSIKKYLENPAKNNLVISPALGFNKYDKWMLGALVSNYAWPPTALRFVAAPLYATGSKKWNGIGNISYSLYPARHFYKVEAAVSGMAFSKRYLPDSVGTPHYERFYRLAPSVRITLKQPVQSTRETWIETKSFFIKEKDFSAFAPASDGKLYVDSLASSSRNINQLTYNRTDYRALYPYQYSVQVQQGPAFYRVNLSGNYFFNYAKGGGAGVRLFVAKFGYLTGNTAKRLTTMRYQPKLLGATGEEDFTYSTYFLGRTASYANDASVVENSGLAAQQIMLRDGALKLRLDQFDFLQGRSDNWVAALNLNTTLPKQLLPLWIPLKLFLDLGTYAGAAKNEGVTNKILYVGGLQLSLLKNVVNIYAPLVYSADFRNNLKSVPEQNTFAKRLTFSIDLSQISVQRFTRNKFTL